MSIITLKRLSRSVATQRKNEHYYPKKVACTVVTQRKMSIISLKKVGSECCNSVHVYPIMIQVNVGGIQHFLAQF